VQRSSEAGVGVGVGSAVAAVAGRLTLSRVARASAQPQPCTTPGARVGPHVARLPWLPISANLRPRIRRL
jgi:hypothetical protein